MTQLAFWPAGSEASERTDADLRSRWRDLVERRLPEAARSRPDWPVRLDHCFGRVLLDNALGRPWREVVPAPAWRNAPGERLAAALALGEAVLAGDADLEALNRRSLAMRGDGSDPLSRRERDGVRGRMSAYDPDRRSTHIPRRSERWSPSPHPSPCGRGGRVALFPTAEHPSIASRPTAPFPQREGRNRDS